MHRTAVPFLAALAIGLIAAPAAFAKDKSATKPTDAQIFAILNTANTGEITLANLAQTNSSNDEVKSFAADMIKDHTAMRDNATQLAQKLTITSEDSDQSAKMKAENDKAMDKLKGMTGADFDRVYADIAMKDHAGFLKMIDKTLMPRAQNTELKAAIKQDRPTVAAHLAHAKQLRSTLAKTNRAMGRKK